jgi:hypothetical protein
MANPWFSRQALSRDIAVEMRTEMLQIGDDDEGERQERTGNQKDSDENGMKKKIMNAQKKTRKHSDTTGK